MIKEKEIIIPYTAIKINANSIPKFSTLNPETNSNSQSTSKSTGL
jgi:hypothetical protein